MAKMDRSIEKLMAARLSLKATLEKAKALAAQIDKSGPRLEVIGQRLPLLEAVIRHENARCSTHSIDAGRVESAIVAASSVLKVTRLVHELRNRVMAMNPRPNLLAYLSLVKQAEDALYFLSQNCCLAIKWLKDVAVYLKANGVSQDDNRLSSLKNALLLLVKLEASGDRARQGGGFLSAAYDKLEIQFRRLLCSGVLQTIDDDQASSVAPTPLPRDVIQSLQSVAERLNAAERLESCGSAYAEVRGLVVWDRIRDLSYEYMDISASELDNVQSMEHHIEPWSQHLEFSIKSLLDAEHRLCNEVFARVAANDQKEIFAKMARKSGIIELISFGYNVTKCKKDPIKLLKLLEVFQALNKLRSDFNRLFSPKACVEIQNSTRDLIKKVVYGAWEIFKAFSAQVELQRHTSPPPDGGVHKLLSFVVNYCNQLLHEPYQQILLQVLFIHQSWEHQEFQEEHLVQEVHSTMCAIEHNLDSWARACDDTILSYLFTMNNRLFLCKNLEGTKLGELMGEPWLRKQMECVEYYATLYFRESWGKLVVLLKLNESLVTTTLSVSSRISIKRKLKTFNDAFDEMCRKQSKWTITDPALRDKICLAVQESVIHAYTEYMSKYGHMLEQDINIVKHSPQRMENMLSGLFRPELGKFGSSKNSSSSASHFVDRLKNVVANHFRSNLAAS